MSDDEQKRWLKRVDEIRALRIKAEVEFENALERRADVDECRKWGARLAAFDDVLRILMAVDPALTTAPSLVAESPSS